MLLKSLNKSLILRIVLIIGIFLVAVFVTNQTFKKSLSLQQEQEQKEVERLSKLSQDELIKEMEEKTIYQPCLEMVDALKNENDCEIYRKTTDRDSCYFCFAITQKDKLFCNKITEGTSLRKSCEKEFLVIEEMEWETYNGAGYSIEYPPYFKVINDELSFTTLGFGDPDLTRKAGFKLEEYITISVQIIDLTRESIAAEAFHNFFKEGSEKEIDGQTYKDIEEINGQIFYKRESWYSYTSLKEVTFAYITKNQEGTRAAIIYFESHRILKDDIPSKLNFKEKVLSSFKF
ncbi:MAG: hypothetical protein A2896_03100 [Candidatus Nealsonbacteria bacterium RIFCSPLOWO2_01_FULL_43_32]|uniref:Uncharacterized protein n=1 Tax=Candidatus Nealsonbacteria bacterium RIFCSPLOWO2_01_FULL_43_32 TaxID=1801672 RepID=A0A1G2EDL6_9BACT|nr:MAG: hypothetical protein A2896_03100 [Candidatus Nealsonbacteria bacterium RIFCSPLOWO2_01_FULL_43_32]